MDKHTPGPWNFDRKSGMVEQVRDKPLSKIICFIHGSAEDAEACANGLLIKAAPDLLSAIEQLWAETVAAGNDTAADYGWPSARKAVLAAIAKAKGG